MNAPAPQFEPSEFLDSFARDYVHHWRGIESDVQAAIETFSGALQALGDRQGTREQAAREFLASELERLSRPLAAYQAWPATRADLIERYTVAKRAVDLAQFAYSNADPAEATARKDALEVELARLRSVGRDINAAIVAIAPATPQRGLGEIVEKARAETQALAGIHRKYPARLLHAALDQGAKASAAGAAADREAGLTRAKLWACYEQPDKKNPKLAEAFALRQARFEEA